MIARRVAAAAAALLGFFGGVAGQLLIPYDTPRLVRLAIMLAGIVLLFASMAIADGGGV